MPKPVDPLTPSELDIEEEESKSRTQKKHEAEAAQELGERLVDLPQKQLLKLDLPESLYDAITQAQSISAHGGKKRQLQFIGKLMRDEELDLEPIKILFASLDGARNTETKAFQQIESWRDKLISEGASAVNELQNQYPEIDAQQLRQLVRNASKNNNEKLALKSKRTIFQILKQALTSE